MVPGVITSKAITDNPMGQATAVQRDLSVYKDQGPYNPEVTALLNANMPSGNTPAVATTNYKPYIIGLLIIVVLGIAIWYIVKKVK